MTLPTSVPAATSRWTVTLTPWRASHVATSAPGSAPWPTAEEVAYYKGLLEAFEAAEKAGLGAVSYHGAMVDYAMLPLAREVLAEAARNR